MSAALVRLGEVAQFINGAAFKPEDWGDEGRKIIRIQNLTDPSKPYNKTLRQVDSKLVVERGDLLVSWSATLGVFEWLDDDALLNQHIFRVIPDVQKVDKNYLKHSLKNAIVGMDKHLHGATMKHINRGEFLATKIPLPPISEQKRIAAILDKATEIKAKREQAIAKLDELAQSTFVEMFGDVKNNVHSFAKKQLGDLIKLSSGDFLPASNMQENGQYAVYGGNGINGYHDAYMFEERRIVIGRVGAYCGCVHITNEKAWVTDNALYVDVKANDLDFEYLAYALMMANLNSVSSKSGQPLVSGSRIYPVEILQPPLPLQQNFAKAKAKIDALKSNELRGMDNVIKLIASLQHQAFTTGFNA